MTPFAVNDLARGLEAQPVTLHKPHHGVDSVLPFQYISHSVVSNHVCIGNSLDDMLEEDCCYEGGVDCVTTGRGCNCSKQNGGFPYSSEGLLKPEYLQEVTTLNLCHSSTFFPVTFFWVRDDMYAFWLTVLILDIVGFCQSRLLLYR